MSWRMAKSLDVLLAEVNASAPSGPTARLLRRTTEVGGCWLWQGGLKENGYGAFGVEGKKVHVHRWSYAQFVGPIPEGYEVDHLCRVRNCINPAHLEAVTLAENRARRVAAHTHCPRGHSLSGDNVRPQRDRQGYVTRVCRICERSRKREGYRRRKAAAA